jgi:hypothetical protein
MASMRDSPLSFSRIRYIYHLSIEVIVRTPPDPQCLGSPKINKANNLIFPTHGLMEKDSSS